MACHVSKADGEWINPAPNTFFPAV